MADCKNYEILCVERSCIPGTWQNEPFAQNISIKELAELLSGKCVWKPRDEVENNPAFKQLIPYLLARIPDNKLACYRRFGNEKRLHGLWASGLGGHIERLDQQTPDSHLMEIVENCALRELHEEFVEPVVDGYSYLGIINEEVTKVGRVHIGIVFLFDLEKPALPGEELNDLQWLPSAEHANLKSELWSQLALNLYHQYQF